MLPIFGGLEGRRNAPCFSRRFLTKVRSKLMVECNFCVKYQLSNNRTKKKLFTTFLFSLFCSGYFNEIINEFPFSRFANKNGNKEL